MTDKFKHKIIFHSVPKYYRAMWWCQKNLKDLDWGLLYVEVGNGIGFVNKQHAVIVGLRFS